MLQPFFKLCSALQKPYCLLIAVAFSALLTLQLCHYIYQQQQQTLINGTVTQYGERIAKLTANQVISSILNNDAISLQAIVQNIYAQSTASSVIIYNINNDILAQTSHTNDTISETTSHHTAPIVSNNNIIGSVTIGVSANAFITPPNNTINLIISLLLLVAIVYFYIKGRAIKPRSHEEPNHTSTTTTTTISEDFVTTPTSTFFLTLNIHNIDTLYRQLNAELRQQQLQQLEQHITHAINLYGGEKHVVHHDSITLSFENAEDILNTLYSAQLILQLNQKTDHSIIALTAFIQHQDTEDTLYHSLDCAKKSFCNTQKQGLFVSATLSQNEQLNTRARLENCDSPKICRISALKENYQNLLDKQLQQLQRTTKETP